MVFVDEASVLLSGAEELAEVEGAIHVVFYVVLEKPAQIVSVDVDGRERFVGVRRVVAEVVFVPLHFGALLHDVVPSKDLFLVVFGKQVEGRTGKLQHAGLWLGECLDDGLPAFGQGALVGFVDDQIIP